MGIRSRWAHPPAWHTFPSPKRPQCCTAPTSRGVASVSLPWIMSIPPTSLICPARCCPPPFRHSGCPQPCGTRRPARAGVLYLNHRPVFAPASFQSRAIKWRFGHFYQCLLQGPIESPFHLSDLSSPWDRSPAEPHTGPPGLDSGVVGGLDSHAQPEFLVVLEGSYGGGAAAATMATVGWIGAVPWGCFFHTLLLPNAGAQLRCCQ